MTRPSAIAVLGPTGSGKSTLALSLAETVDGEIVNCDSIQLYRGFDIGAAKPSPAERARLPHHLFDVLAPEEICSAGDYARLARAQLAEIACRGRVPVVVGGTGFYARALFDGLFEGPARDTDLRARLAAAEQRRAGVLTRLLARLDPAAAKRIHPNDTNKLIRAVEVCLAARRPMSELWQSGRSELEGFDVRKFVLDPPREALAKRLDARCIAMLQAGLITEVAALLCSGVSPGAKPFESIGYKEVLAYLEGRLDLSPAVELMQRNTRRYAKRQRTWFRRERGANVLAGFGESAHVLDSARHMLQQP